MKWLGLFAVLVFAEACSDCPAGVCADFDEVVARPGPCESGYESDGYEQRCQYTYAADRLARVDCTWREHGTDAEHGADTSIWQYDAAGNVSRIDYSHEDYDEGIGSDSWAWVWSGDTVERWNGGWSGPLALSTRYDRATFAFLPLVGSDVIAPEKDATHVTEIGHTYTETTTGNVVTRTRDDGVTVSYELDDTGHVIQRSQSGSVSTWTYDGDRITARTMDSGGRHARWTYAYDDAGNVAQWTDDDGYGREAYDYSCW